MTIHVFIIYQCIYDRQYIDLYKLRHSLRYEFKSAFNVSITYHMLNEMIKHFELPIKKLQHQK